MVENNIYSFSGSRHWHGFFTEYIFSEKQRRSSAKFKNIKFSYNPSAGRGAVAILGGACFNMVGYFMHTVEIKNRPFCSLS